MGTETTALVVRDQRTDPVAFEPANTGELMRYAEMLVKSGLAPDGIRTPEAAAIVIAMGRELGLSAMQSIRGIHVIKGKPSASADLMVGLVKKTPGICQYFQLVKMTPTSVTARTHRVGEPEPVEYTYTWDDAVKAGMAGGDNYKKHPTAMLKARCFAALARAVYPDVVLGLYDPDELADLDEPAPQPRNVTPLQRAARQAPVAAPVEDFLEAEMVQDEPQAPARATLAAALLALEPRIDAYFVARTGGRPTADMTDEQLAKALDYLQTPAGATSLARWRALQTQQAQPAGPRETDLPGPPANSLRALRDEYRKLGTPVAPGTLTDLWHQAAAAEGLDPSAVDMKSPWALGEAVARRVVEALRDLAEDEVPA